MTSALHAAVVDDLDRFLNERENQVATEVSSILSAANESLLNQLRSSYNDIAGLDMLAQRRALLLAAENTRLQQFLNPGESERIQQIYQDLIAETTEATRASTQQLIRIGNQSDPTYSAVGIPAREIAVVAEQSKNLLLGHGERFAQQATTAIGIGLANNQSFNAIAEGIRAIGTTTLSQAMNIARTEVTRANNTVAQDNYRRAGIQYWVWMATATDACPYCIGRNMHVYSYEESTPPIHGRCRCYSLPATPGTMDVEWMQEYYETSIEGSDFEPTSRLTKWEREAGAKREAVWSPRTGWRDERARQIIMLGQLPEPTPPPARTPQPTENPHPNYAGIRLESLPNQEQIQIANNLALDEGRQLPYRLVGNGASGKAYVERSTGELLKVGTVRHQSFQGTTDDIANQIAANRAGVGPRVIGASTVDDAGVGTIRMEFVNGQGISQYLSEASPQQRRDIGLQMIRQVRQLHDAGIAHNDLHSGNMIVRSNGELSIIDYGLSDVASSPGNLALTSSFDYIELDTIARGLPIENDVRRLTSLAAEQGTSRQAKENPERARTEIRRIGGELENLFNSL